jgi:hypothetical protein
MRKLLFFLAFTAVAGMACAQSGQARFYTQVSDTSVLQGNPITVAFVLENGEGGRFEAPDWESAGFAVYGSSQSSSISIQNGVKRVSATYEYTVAPHREGTLVIPSAVMKNGGKTYHTDPVNIQVQANPEGITEQRKPGRPRSLSPAEPPAKPRKPIKTTRI